MSATEGVTLSSLAHLSTPMRVRLVEWLKSKGFLTHEDKEEIESSELSHRQTEVLYEKLLWKGAEAVATVQSFLEEFSRNAADGRLEEPQVLRETHEAALKEAGVPPLPKGFLVPRLALVRKVRAALLDGGKSGKAAVAVTGPGGAGKTTLLIDALRDTFLLDAFRSRIVWLHIGDKARDDQQILNKLNSLCSRLGWSRQTELSDFPEALDNCCEEFVRQTDKPLPLLVLDNVWDADIFDRLGTSFPRLVSCRAKPTSSDFLDIDLSGSGLTLEERRQVFANALGGRETEPPAEIGPLIDACPTLPLAVALMSQLVAKADRCNLAAANAELLKAMEERKTWREPVKFYYSDNTASEEPLINIVKLCLEALRRDDPSWFGRFAFFAIYEAETWIPEAVLCRLWSIRGQSLNWSDLIQENLVNKSLLLVVEEEEEEEEQMVMYGVRSIIRDVLLETLEKSEVIEKHREVSERYREACGGRWGDVPDNFVVSHICRHMLAAGMRDMAAEALKDIRFVSRRLQMDGRSVVAQEAEEAEEMTGDPVLSGLKKLFRDPRTAALHAKYPADLEQVCALLPGDNAVRLWAEGNGRGGLWRSAEPCGQEAGSASWEVVHGNLKNVSALAVAERSSGMLVAVTTAVGGDTGAPEAIAMEGGSQLVFARFQLDSKGPFKKALLVKGDSLLLLLSKAGDLFTFKLPCSLQELFKKHKTHLQGAQVLRLEARKVETDAHLLDVEAKGQSVITMTDRGRFQLFRLDSDGDCPTVRGPIDEKLDAMMTSAYQGVLEERKRRNTMAFSYPDRMGYLSDLRTNTDMSEFGLAMSTPEGYLVAFCGHLLALLKIEGNSMHLMSEPCKREKAIRCASFITVKGPDEMSKKTLLLAEATGGEVLIREIDKMDQILIKVMESCNDVSALMSNNNDLYVYTRPTFSAWSVPNYHCHAVSAKKKFSTHFNGTCSDLCFSNFPTFISGKDGSLVQLQEKSEMKKFSSSALMAEVLTSRNDLFLVEDIPDQQRVRMTNLRTKKVELDHCLPHANIEKLIHGLSTDGETLAIGEETGAVHVFDLNTGDHVLFDTSKKFCKAVCPTLNHSLFVGFDDGSILTRSKDSSEFTELIGSEPYFVKYLTRIDARQKLASVSLSKRGDECKIRIWTNIGSSRPPECKTNLPGFICKFPISDLKTTTTLFVETHASRPSVDPSGSYMAMILPVYSLTVDHSSLTTLVVVIDLESEQHIEKNLDRRLDNMHFMKLGGSTWLLAISQNKFIRATIDKELFERDDLQLRFHETDLHLGSDLRFLTPCGENEVIITASDTVTTWQIDDQGLMENGRHFLSKSGVTGDFVASYANVTTLVIVTRPKNDFQNHFYLFEK